MKCRCASVLVLRLAPFDQVPTRRPLPQRAGAAPLPQQAAAALFLFHRTCRRVCAYVCVCVCVCACLCVFCVVFAFAFAADSHHSNRGGVRFCRFSERSRTCLVTLLKKTTLKATLKVSACDIMGLLFQHNRGCRFATPQGLPLCNNVRVAFFVTPQGLPAVTP